MVSVWTNGLLGAARGETVLLEDFCGLTPRKNTAVWMVDELNQMGSYGRWSGETLRGYPEESGALTLGTTTLLGHLLSGPLPGGEGHRLRLRMTRLTSDDRRWAVVSFVKDGQAVYGPTNVWMSTTDEMTFADEWLEVGVLPEGCALRVASAPYETASGNIRHGRLALSEVQLVRNAADGQVCRFPVVESLQVMTNAYRCPVWDATVYGYSVATAEGTILSEGAVDMADPPWLRCWCIGDFTPRPGFRQADFSSLQSITKATDWTNGVDGDRFYAFSDEGAIQRIGRNNGSSTVYGLYATETNECGVAHHVLSVLGTGTSGMRLVLPVKLDAAQDVVGFGVRYRAHQVSFRARRVPTELSFAWCGIDDLGELQSPDLPWQAVAEAAFVSPCAEGSEGPATFAESSAERMVILPAAQLRGARYIGLRWQVPRQANSSMMGLSAVRVEVALREAGTRFLIK